MSAYEVVTLDITFTGDGNYDVYTLTAPSGKKPVSAGIQQTAGVAYGRVLLYDSYPSGGDWHFTVWGNNSHMTATLYLVCLPTYTITAD